MSTLIPLCLLCHWLPSFWAMLFVSWFFSRMRSCLEKKTETTDLNTTAPKVILQSKYPSSERIQILKDINPGKKINQSANDLESTFEENNYFLKIQNWNLLENYFSWFMFIIHFFISTRTLKPAGKNGFKILQESCKKTEELCWF